MPDPGLFDGADSLNKFRNININRREWKEFDSRMCVLKDEVRFFVSLPFFSSPLTKEKKRERFKKNEKSSWRTTDHPVWHKTTARQAADDTD
jgi:hypothetical protein